MKNLKGLTLFLLAILAFAGCNDDEDPAELQLSINYLVDDQPLVFDQELYTSAAGYDYSIITLRYYLSRIRIRTQLGTGHDLADVRYFDARDASLSVLDFGEIPPGTYTSLEFIFGLDEVMNVDGGLDNTLENINMEWPIPGDQGYHYMKFEGKYTVDPPGEIHSFNLHTGATGGNQNYITVALDLPSAVMDNGLWQIELDMDLNEWLENPVIYDFEEFGSAIMMNQQAQEVLKANGSTVFSIGNVKKL